MLIFIFLSLIILLLLSICRSLSWSELLFYRAWSWWYVVGFYWVYYWTVSISINTFWKLWLDFVWGRFGWNRCFLFNRVLFSHLNTVLEYLLLLIMLKNRIYFRFRNLNSVNRVNKGSGVYRVDRMNRMYWRKRLD